MITLIIVFILDIIGNILDAKTFKDMCKEMFEIKSFIFSLQELSPFPEFEPTQEAKEHGNKTDDTRV